MENKRNQLKPKQNSTTQVVREAMRIVSKDVRPPKVVRDGLVKPNQKQYSQEEVDELLDQQAARTTSQLIGNPSVGTNAKQFKEANESLMSAYLDKFDNEGKMKFFKVLIDKFSDEDKIKALNILVCSISTIDNKFNSLLNQISNYK